MLLIQLNVQFLDGGVPGRCFSYQYICSARLSSNVFDFNSRHLFLIAKILKL